MLQNLLQLHRHCVLDFLFRNLEYQLQAGQHLITQRSDRHHQVLRRHSIRAAPERAQKQTAYRLSRRPAAGIEELFFVRGVVV